MRKEEVFRCHNLKLLRARRRRGGGGRGGAVPTVSGQGEKERKGTRGETPGKPRFLLQVSVH